MIHALNSPSKLVSFHYSANAHSADAFDYITLFFTKEKCVRRSQDRSNNIVLRRNAIPNYVRGGLDRISTLYLDGPIWLDQTLSDSVYDSLRITLVNPQLIT